jgi:O-succinylbenzoic acid--CoA ligase
MYPHPPAHLPDWLARRAADHHDRPAIIAGCGAGARRWSFAELDAAATTLAEELGGAGIGAGDRAAVILPNGPSYVTLVHALTRLGAVLVPINLRLAPAEVAWQLGHTRARLLIHDPSTTDLASAAVAAGGAVPTLTLAEGWPGDDLAVGRPGSATAVAWHRPRPDRGDLRAYIDPAAVQCIMYTSGTTGRPKGALLTYGNHWWSAVASALNLGLHGDDRWLVCLPLFHIGGLSILFRSLIYGMPIVFPEMPDPGGGRSFDPAAVNRAIVEHGATIISVVATQVQRLLETEDPPLPKNGTLRCLLLGGGPAPLPLLEACVARGLPVVQTYGLTESASQVVTLAPSDALRKLGSAGRPLLPNEVRIGDTFTAEATRKRVPGRGEDTEREGEGGGRGDAVEPAAGLQAADRSGYPPKVGVVAAIRPQSEAADGFAVGEILVRGPTISPGYLGDEGGLVAPVPAADAEGWLHTGDVGYLDAEGFLYVLDRRSDLIISGGENVYPAEVEAVLLAHPAVAEAGVYGVSDPRWGQVVAAAVVPRLGMAIDEAEVLAFCRARLARYKVPSRLRVATTLPRNASGKLMRRALREG